MSQSAVQIVNLEVSAESKIGKFDVKVEKGDLKQNGTIYPNMVRRVTVADGAAGQETTQVFRGHDCTKKASKWLKQATSDEFVPEQNLWMWL
jgi:hypothetical protein